MKEPSVLISLRMTRELWTKINDLIDERIIPDFSHAARNLIDAELWLHEHKDDLTNPETSKKFIEEYNSKTNENNLFAWTGQLTEMQIQGMQSALEIEKEKRINKL
jgi:hypothetical protein